MGNGIDVRVVCKYLDFRGKHKELERQAVKLRKHLADMERELERVISGESEALSLIDPDCLITAKSVKTINQLLLSVRGLCQQDGVVMPMSYMGLVLKGGKLRVNAVFAKPLFVGWETKIPYYSYQSCSLSIETPEPPSENHIPRYQVVVDQEVNVSCWEQRDGEVRLWGVGGMMLKLVLEGDNTQ